MILPVAGADCGSPSPWRGYHAVCPAGLEGISATLHLSGSSCPFLPRVGQTFSVDWGLGITPPWARDGCEDFDEWLAVMIEKRRPATPTTRCTSSPDQRCPLTTNCPPRNRAAERGRRESGNGASGAAGTPSSGAATPAIPGHCSVVPTSQRSSNPAARPAWPRWPAVQTYNHSGPGPQ